MIAVTEEDKRGMLKEIKRRRRIYALCYFAAVALMVIMIVLAFKINELFVVPGIIFELCAVIMGSFVVWCINNYKSLLYDGETGGGGFRWLVWFILSGILPPIIIVAILRNSNLGFKVLGCVKVDD